MKLFLYLLIIFVTGVACHQNGYLPQGSFGRLEQNSEYQSKGDIWQVEDLELYVVRPGQTGDISKWVVWGHDIFGWHSGHTVQLVDKLAADTEYTVVLPNLFRGQERPKPEAYKWETNTGVSALD